MSTYPTHKELEELVSPVACEVNEDAGVVVGAQALRVGHSGRVAGSQEAQEVGCSHLLASVIHLLVRWIETK